MKGLKIHYYKDNFDSFHIVGGEVHSEKVLCKCL